MDKAWVNFSRLTKGYRDGAMNFVKMAAKNRGSDMIVCPCIKCRNLKYHHFDMVYEHLVIKGMDPRYTNWVFHGEHLSTSIECEDVEMRETYNMDKDMHFQDEDVLEATEERRESKLINFVEEAETPLYLGCTKYTKMSAITETPVPSEVSRVDVWIRGHMRKNGEPANEAVGNVVAKLLELTQSTSTQQSKASIRDDAISRVLGPERRGRVRGLGLGVTPSRLDAQVQSTRRVKQLEQNLLNLQTRIDELKVMLLKQAQQSQSKNFEDTMNTHAATPQPHQKNQSETGRDNLINARCELLDWNSFETKVVAHGKVVSTDPNTKVHHILLGAAWWKVCVDQVFDKNMPMCRPTQEMSVLEDAVGSPTAWPIKFIRLL